MKPPRRLRHRTSMPVSRATDPAGPRCRGSGDRRVPAGHRRERADRRADATDIPRQQIAIGMLNDVQCGWASRTTQCCPQVIEAARIENVGWVEPAAPRLLDGVAHESELSRIVGVGREHELHADLLSKLAMPFAKVEPVRLTIDLDRAAALARTHQK